MSMNDLLKAFNLIKTYPNICDFGEDPKDENLIILAEQVLELKFSPTYRLFLKDYGSIGIGGYEIYGIVDKNFENSGCPNGIWLTLDERKTSNLPHHFIIISDTGDGYWYCLDASQASADGEYPVVIWGLGIPEENKEKVNEDFGEFLLEQVTSSLSPNDYTPDPKKVENDERIEVFWNRK